MQHIISGFHVTQAQHKATKDAYLCLGLAAAPICCECKPENRQTTVWKLTMNSLGCATRFRGHCPSPSLVVCMEKQGFLPVHKQSSADVVQAFGKATNLQDSQQKSASGINEHLLCWEAADNQWCPNWAGSNAIAADAFLSNLKSNALQDRGCTVEQQLPTTLCNLPGCCCLCGAKHWPLGNA